jgi:hypothetical protein
VTSPSYILIKLLLTKLSIYENVELFNPWGKHHEAHTAPYMRPLIVG